MTELHSIALDDSDELIISINRPNGSGTTDRPAVLVFPTWAGRNDFAEGKAAALTKLGYLGIAVDVYGGGRTGATPDECAALMNPLMENRFTLRNRMLALLDGIRSDVAGVDRHRIAAIGFCFGGLCVLDLARSGAELRGVLSFHGLFQPPPEDLKAPVAERIPAKVLALHGYDDPMVPVEQVAALADEFTDAGADWQIHAYGATMHAFTNPAANDVAAGTVYKESADRRSRITMENFLAEIFADQPE